MTNEPRLNHKLTEVLFLRSYHNLPGVSNGEEIDYYTPDELRRLQEDLATNIKHQFDLFSESEYEDYFSCVDYEEPDCLDDSEIETFRSLLDPDERKLPLTDLHPRSLFTGYRSVVHSRVQNGDLHLIRKGIELFNSVMESALPTDDERNPRSWFGLETAEEFAPIFIDRLLKAIQAADNPRSVYTVEGQFGEAIRQLEPLLRMLAFTVHHQRWPHSDLALGKFLLIVDYYKRVVEEQWE